MAAPRVKLRVEIPVELSQQLEDYIATSGKTKTAVTIAEAIWTGDGWDTDFSHLFLPVTAEEVAQKMDYDAVREAGYTIVD